MNKQFLLAAIFLFISSVSTQCAPTPNGGWSCLMNQYANPQSSCDSWNYYLANGINPLLSYQNVRLNGSRNGMGAFCTNAAVADQICKSLHSQAANPAPINQIVSSSFNCDGIPWFVGWCYGTLEISTRSSEAPNTNGFCWCWNQGYDNETKGQYALKICPRYYPS